MGKKKRMIKSEEFCGLRGEVHSYYTQQSSATDSLISDPSSSANEPFGFEVSRTG